MSEEEDGFLSRWSRRKRGELPEEENSPPPPPTTCPLPGVPEIDLSDLPSIADLTEGSDFSLFLRPGIPAALRSAALRRMWSLDPGIRDFIGPADYAWDYNNPAGMPPGFSLDLGGDLKKLLAQAIGEREEEEAPALAPPKPEPEPAALPPPESVRLAGDPPLLEQEALPDPEPPAPRRRHGGALPV